MIETERLILKEWQEDHFLPFVELHASPEVMADLGGEISQAESQKKFDRYCQALREYKISRWAVETKQGEFIGYAGVMPRMEMDHPLGKHYEVGWRFRSEYWGNGYATESARAAIEHAVTERQIKEIVPYSIPDNFRSQAVMRRLGLQRAASRDFVLHHPSGKKWELMVWVVL